MCLHRNIYLKPCMKATQANWVVLDQDDPNIFPEVHEGEVREPEPESEDDWSSDDDDLEIDHNSSFSASEAASLWDLTVGARGLDSDLLLAAAERFRNAELGLEMPTRREEQQSRPPDSQEHGRLSGQEPKIDSGNQDSSETIEPVPSSSTASNSNQNPSQQWRSVPGGWLWVNPRPSNEYKLAYPYITAHPNHSSSIHNANANGNRPTEVHAISQQNAPRPLMEIPIPCRPSASARFPTNSNSSNSRNVANANAIIRQPAPIPIHCRNNQPNSSIIAQGRGPLGFPVQIQPNANRPPPQNKLIPTVPSPNHPPRPLMSIPIPRFTQSYFPPIMVSALPTTYSYPLTVVPLLAPLCCFSPRNPTFVVPIPFPFGPAYPQMPPAPANMNPWPFGGRRG